MTLPADPGIRHIPAPAAEDWWAPDEHARWLVGRMTDGSAGRAASGALADLGRLVPTVIEPLAREADRHPPVLRQYDARGARVDEIEFHPAYRELERTVAMTGVVRASFVPGWRGLETRAPAVVTLAMNYLLMQADQSITGCPIGMMGAMARCLERNDQALAEKFVPGLADDTGHHLTAGMFLTEKAGGSDVGANETVAVRGEDGVWRLHGEKWFASCPQSDLILVMARPDGAGPGSRGLGLFLLPRFLADGSRNPLVLHRLKEKIGTRAMASSEAGLRGAEAWPVGDLGRGMKQMLDMVNHTRVGIAAGTAAVMRRCAVEALGHAGQRSTFGRRLADHPLMRDTLAELVVDSVAGFTAAMGVARALDDADAGRPGAAGVLRLLTPLLKAAGCERARLSAIEAMEVRGGNGAIEDWPNSRILRDVLIHSIWEGPGNIMALDVQRAIARGAFADWAGDVEVRAEAAGDQGPAAPLAAVILRSLRDVESQLGRLAALDPDAAQLPMRRVARRMALLATSARLVEQAGEYAADTGSGRLAWIAARYTARLGGDDAVAAVADDAGWLAYADALLYGGPVPLDIGRDAATAVAGALGAAAPVALGA